ncbi:M20 family metallo-hydrolase [bacterium]|nr:M20 family metallo-hydrolase [bacterium]
MKICSLLDQSGPEVIEIQEALTAIPAIGPENGGQGESEKFEVLKKFIDRLAPDEFFELSAPDPRVPSGFRPNALTVFHGSSAERTVWIMAHMDVVPPGDLSQWSSDPHRILVRDGKIFGRGTEDNHQAIASALAAVGAIRKAGIKSAWNVGLAFVSDEETGSRFGIDYVLRQRHDLFKQNDFIVIPDSGDPWGTQIEVAEKSILWIRCETRGRQTHGSTPEKGCNAHRAAAHFIVQMDRLHALFDEQDALYDPPGSTFEPTKKEANVENINTVPGRDVVYFDCRILPQYPLNKIKDRIRRYATQIEKKYDVQIDLSYVQEASAPPPTQRDAPVVQALQRAVKNVLKRDAKPVGIGGGTVAAVFRSHGLPAVCWCTLEDTMHGPNEYSRIDNTLSDAKVFGALMLSI